MADYGTISYRSESDNFMPTRRRRGFGYAKAANDFANLFKAFIGSGYLSMPFGFYQSGYVLGTVCLLCVSGLAVHCCQLIVKCKREAVRMIVFGIDYESDAINDPSFPDEIKEKINRVERNISYGNIGTLAIGRWGSHLVNINVFVSQIGFCVNYFIFIGNQIASLFPFDAKNTSSIIPSTPIDNSYVYLDVTNTTMTSPTSNTSLTTPIVTTTGPLTSPMPSLNPIVYVPTAPSEALLCLMPLPIFLTTSLIRDIRGMGPVSIVANICLISGFLIVVGLILNDLIVLKGIFHSSGLLMFNWATFPVFFGMVTNAFEGIGVVIPIETSMAGNRHRFPAFLYVTMVIVTCILASSGILGYLDYGFHVEQIVLQNLDVDSFLVKLVIVLLIVAVVFTYPLQLFPCIEITERAIFTPGRIFGPPLLPDESDSRKEIDPEDAESLVDSSNSYRKGALHSGSLRRGDERDQLLHSINECTENEGVENPMLAGMAVPIPASVATWKRNIVRALLVCVTLGAGILFFDDFAYFNSFIGAVSSTFLAFILPGLFHLQLLKGRLSYFVIAKDIFLIVFGFVGGIVTIVVVVDLMVDKHT